MVTSLMASLVQCRGFLLLALAGGCLAFRSDYEWNDEAGGWLKYHAEAANWDDARRTCFAEGAILASPLSDKLEAAMVKFVLKKFGYNDEHEVTIFTGVHATFSDGDYSSIEGVPLRRLAVTWAPGEPDNLEDQERCLSMTIGYYGTMADTRCDKTLPYICYKEATEKKFRFDYEWSEQAKGWLKYHEVPTTWWKAAPRCEAEGAVLASPLNADLESAIVTFVQNQGVFTEQGVTILSGIRRHDDWNFRSIEGIHVSQLSVHWAPQEADTTGSKQHCLAMNIGYNGTMARTSCDRVLPYVCYKSDTELTMSECGTTDPEYHLETSTGSCYKLHKKGRKWADAYKTCVAEGGYLVIVNNNVEAEVVKQIIVTWPKSAMIADQTGLTSVGIHDWNGFGRNFMTIHGQALDTVYNVWLDGEPNNGTNSGSGHPGEYCITVERAYLGLNDYECNVPVAFMCEKNPNSLLEDFRV